MRQGFVYGEEPGESGAVKHRFLGLAPSMEHCVTMIDPAIPENPLALAILDHLPDAIVVVDGQGQQLFANPSAQGWLAVYLPSFWDVDPTGTYRVLDRHFSPLSAEHLPLRRVAAGETLANEEMILVGPGAAGPLWIWVSGGPVVGPGAAGLLSVRTISASRSGVYDRRELGDQDPLTQLPTRSVLMDWLNHRLTQSPAAGSMALLAIDLDRFQRVNTHFGHGVGNQLLRQLGQRLKWALPAQAMVAHLGGDAFAVVIDSLTQADEALTWAETLRQDIIQPFHLANQEIYVDVSLGIAPGPAAYHHAEDWLHDASTALATIQDVPSQHWRVFDESLPAQEEHRFQAELALRQALERGELRLHYQPIVTISTQAIIGFEALVRWQHPERGLLMPAEFIALAEASGLIIPLSWWVLEEACQQMQTWTAAHPGMAHFTVSVNLSSQQFFQNNFVAKVQDILTKTGFDPHRLKLEITEGVLIDHSDSIIATLKELREMGIRLAVDDFGTGYSSLSYLHRFPFDSLKIDRSFIENADQDFEKLEILQSVVRLAWNLGLDVVAEGVETHRHYAQLKALRCESGQGYLFSKPLPPSAMEHVLGQAPLPPTP